MPEDEPYGIIAAAQRARDWCPRLKTQGQRHVLTAMVLFVRRDSTADPTSGQLEAVVGFRASSIRRILSQLEMIGALARVGQRPVYTNDGSGRGGKVIVWSIPPAPQEATVGVSLQEHSGDSHSRPAATPLSRPSTPKRASEGAPLNAERTESAAAADKRPVREQIASLSEQFEMHR